MEKKVLMLSSNQGYLSKEKKKQRKTEKPKVKNKLKYLKKYIYVEFFGP